MSDITDYIAKKIAEARSARLLAEVVWAFGACISVAGLYFGILLLVIAGFLILFGGLYLSVYYELRRLDYILVLEKFRS